MLSKIIISLFFSTVVLLLPNSVWAEQSDKRIAQIAVTGEYIKKTASDKKSVSKTNRKKRTKKRTKRNHVCLGGSYKAFNKKSKKYSKSIAKYSAKYNVPKALIKAVITAESCFQSKAVSPKGAQGLMQLMPATAKRFGVSNSFNPDSNIRGGTRYLKFLLKRFDQDLVNTVAAYNAGEGAVDRYKGVPPYRETRLYVSKVAALYHLFLKGGGVLTADSFKNNDLAMSFFKPRAMPRSQFSPYKGRVRNISHGNCANRTGTRLRKSTILKSGRGVWQRTYIVKHSETLSRVSQRTGVHRTKIAQMNGLRSRSKLKQGQVLLMWECRK